MLHNKTEFEKKDFPGESVLVSLCAEQTSMFNFKTETVNRKDKCNFILWVCSLKTNSLITTYILNKRNKKTINRKH